MKSPFRMMILVSIVPLAMVLRGWMLSGKVDKDLDSPIQWNLPAEFDSFVKSAEQIRPLHQKKRPVQPGDWLDRFPEGGQAFGEYVQFRSSTPLHSQYKTIDIQPLGEFDDAQQQILGKTAEFMGHYFGVPVRVLDAKPFGEIPESSKRMRNDTEQVLSTWIMNDVLLPARDPEAMATIAIVTCDLWPGDLNWVFGQASMKDRVGVWSLYRNGDPRVNEESFRLCLRRTLKTAAHETGHMLGIPHCARWECCMNGSRSREENDRQSLEFCPECQPKIWWSCGADPAKRCQALVEFCEREGLSDEADLFKAEAEALAK